MNTPRTEAALIDNADLYDSGFGKSNMVSADFAREIEKELTAEKQRADKAESEIQSWTKYSEQWIKTHDKIKPETFEEWSLWVRGWNQLKLENIRHEQERDSLKQKLAELTAERVAISTALDKEFNSAKGDFRGCDLLDDLACFIEHHKEKEQKLESMTEARDEYAKAFNEQTEKHSKFARRAEAAEQKLAECEATILNAFQELAMFDKDTVLCRQSQDTVNRILKQLKEKSGGGK